MPCNVFRTAPWALLICASTLLPHGSVTAQSASADLAELARFVPHDAAVFMIAQPRQFMTSPLGQKANGLQPRPNSDFDPASIEFVAGAMTLGEVFGAIEEMASEMSPSPNQTPERIQHASGFTPRAAILVRFAHPVSADDLIAWIKRQDVNDKQLVINKAQWQGHEIIRSNERDVPAVMQMDNRSFIIADQKSLAAGMQADANGDEHQEIWESLIAQQKADLAITWDVQKLIALTRQQMPAPGFLEEATLVTMGLGFSQGHLANLEIRFANPDAANEASTMLQTLHQFGMMQVDAKTAGLAPEQREVAELLLPLAKSLQFNLNANAVSVIVPRPVNWEKLVDRLIELGMEETR